MMNLLRERMYYIDDEEEERFFFVYLFNKQKSKYEKIKLYTDFDYYDYNLTLRNHSAMMVPAVKYPSKDYFKDYALTKNSNFMNLKVLKFHPKSVIIHPKMKLAFQRQTVNPILTQFIINWDNKYNSDFYGARSTYKEYVDKDFREMFGYRDQLWHYLYLYLKASNQKNYKVLRRLRVHFYNSLQIERNYLTVFKHQALFYKRLSLTSRSILPSFVEDKAAYKFVNHGIMSPVYPSRGFRLLKRFKLFSDHNSLHVIEPFELPKALDSFGISNFFYEHDIPERAYNFVIPFTDIIIDLDDQNDDDELDIDNDDTEVCEEPNFIAAGVDDPIEEPDDDLIDESYFSEYFELNENIWWAYYTCQQDLELELFFGRPDFMRTRIEFDDEDDFDDPENSEETTNLGNEFSFNDQPPYFASFFSWLKASLILVLFFNFLTDLVRVYKIDRAKQVDPYKIIFIIILITLTLLLFGRVLVR